MSKPDHATYLWLPGQGPDSSALERMCREFPKPKKPMGEAWFMSDDRRMFPELLGDLENLSDEQIERALDEIATGPSCFGQHDEWTEWYHYLLPRLMLRQWRPYIRHPVEVLITGFMAQHPEPIDRRPYADFRTDALLTLGRYIMSPNCWPGGVLDAEKCLSKYQNVSGTYGWYECDGLMSASLFFCLKYLPEDAAGSWFESVIAIPDPRWTAQLVVWLVGAYPILTGAIDQPKQFPEDGPFRIGWEWSHVLSGNYSGSFEEPIILSPFLPAENKDAVLQIVRGLDMDEYFENLLTDPELEYVAAEMAGAPERFMELYGSDRS